MTWWKTHILFHWYSRIFKHERLICFDQNSHRIERSTIVTIFITWRKKKEKSHKNFSLHSHFFFIFYFTLYPLAALHEFQFSGRFVFCCFLFFCCFCSFLSILDLLKFNGISFSYIHIHKLPISSLLFFAAFPSLRILYTWSISNSAAVFFLLLVLLRIFNSNQAVESETQRGKINVHVSTTL